MKLAASLLEAACEQSCLSRSWQRFRFEHKNHSFCNGTAYVAPISRQLIDGVAFT
jgi:hypothetical protein